jgi:hypothetical protein
MPQRTRNDVWDVGLLAWSKMQQPTLEADEVTVEGSLSVTNMIPPVETNLAKDVSVRSNYKKLIDYDGGAVPVYIGIAESSSAASAAAWRITKTAYNLSTSPISILYADGVTTFTKVWDDRATYSYS